MVRDHRNKICICYVPSESRSKSTEVAGHGGKADQHQYQWQRALDSDQNLKKASSTGNEALMEVYWAKHVQTRF